MFLKKLNESDVITSSDNTIKEDDSSNAWRTINAFTSEKSPIKLLQNQNNATDSTVNDIHENPSFSINAKQKIETKTMRAATSFKVRSVER